MLLAASPATAQKSHKTKPKIAPIESADIENTGSTNTTGYQMVVNNLGNVTISEPFEPGSRAVGWRLPQHHTIPATLARKFFTDLNAAVPLTSLPVRHGMRSASFGTSTYIAYKGRRSPDLTFASDARTVALKADIDQIVKTLHVVNAPRRPIVVRMNRVNPL